MKVKLLPKVIAYIAAASMLLSTAIPAVHAEELGVLPASEALYGETETISEESALEEEAVETLEEEAVETEKAEDSLTERTFEDVCEEEDEEETQEDASDELWEEESSEELPEEDLEDKLTEELEEDFEHEPQEPSLGAVTIVMEDGGVYDIGTYEKATTLVSKGSGTCTIKGSSEKTVIEVNLNAGDDFKIIFDNVVIRTGSGCPGAPTARHSAISVEGTGKLTLSSAAGSRNEFYGTGGLPCIRKDYLDSELHFVTEDPSHPGYMLVKADPKATMTSGIGAYTRFATSRCFGNVYFDSGKIDAYGSTGHNGNEDKLPGISGDGGPGIGADGGTDVDGVYFTGADVLAVAGNGTAACIGTCSNHGLSESDKPSHPSVGGEDRLGDPEEPGNVSLIRTYNQCKNIVISGGTVRVWHNILTSRDLGDYWGGAGIGGGMLSNAIGIKITGGTVEATGVFGGAAIGGGWQGDGEVEITGGKVKATGSYTAIGSGGCPDGSHGEGGDARIKISGGDITAISGKAERGQTTHGVGIGGWKHYNSIECVGKTEITITGGRIYAEGSLRGTAIGSGEHGHVKSLKISGGIIMAKAGSKSNSIGAGTTGNIHGSVGHLEISGGTIMAYSDTNHLGVIGGFYHGGSNGSHFLREVPCDVYISGGNVRAHIYKVTPKQSPDGPDVFLNEYRLASYGKAVTGEYFEVTGLDLRPRSTAYGTNDIYVIGSLAEEESSSLYFWLPKEAYTDEVRLKESFYKDTEEKLFTGVTKPEQGGDLYPLMRYWLDNPEEDMTKTYAGFYMGTTGTKDIHNPMHHPGRLKYWSLDAEGKVPFLNSEGTYYPNVSYKAPGSDEVVLWTDSVKRMVAPLSATDPKIYNGIHLYGQYENVVYNLHFEGNAPVTASTKLIGSIDSMLDVNDDYAITLPAGGLTLPGYRLDSWNTVYNGTGISYKPGETVSHINKDFVYDMTLYAQWVPVKYSVLFKSSDNPKEYAADERTYDFETYPKLPTIEEIRTGNPTFRKAGYRFVGWTAVDTVTGKPYLGSLYGDGEVVYNLCSFNADNAPVGYTLIAKWAPIEQIQLILRLDRKALDVEPSRIKVKYLSDGTIYTPFVRNEAGVYSYDSKSPIGSLPEGACEIIVDTEELRHESLPIEFVTGADNRYEMSFNTITMENGDSHVHGSLEYKGERGLKLVVLGQPDITLHAEMDPGYAFFRFNSDGILPDWRGSQKDNPKTIGIHGPVKIIAHSEADPITYTIGYALNGGHFKNRVAATSYTVESESFTLETPVKAGCVFAGWTGDEFSGRRKKVTIEKGSVGDRFYTAHWTKEEEPEPNPTPGPDPGPNPGPGPDPGPKPAPNPAPEPMPYGLPGADSVTSNVSLMQSGVIIASGENTGDYSNLTAWACVFFAAAISTVILACRRFR